MHEYHVKTGCRQAGLSNIRYTSKTIKLANASATRVIGFVYDLDVQIKNCFILTDFLTLDNEIDVTMLLANAMQI